MARDVKVEIGNTVQDGFPAGTVFGKLHLSLTDKTDASKTFSTDVDDSNGQPSEFTFPLVPEGSYTAVAQRLDASGAPLGAGLSQDIDVVALPPPATVSGPIPSAITVTLQ